MGGKHHLQTPGGLGGSRSVHAPFQMGEVSKAFVKTRPGATVTAEDIIGFRKDHMARFNSPKFVEFSDLPKTATGKIQKFKLREQEWSGYERKVG